MWPCLFIKIQVRLQNNATLTVVHCIHVHSNVQIQIRSQNMTLLDSKIILHNLCWYPFLLFLLFHLLFCLRLSSSFLPNKLIAELISNNDYCIIKQIVTNNNHMMHNSGASKALRTVVLLINGNNGNSYTWKIAVFISTIHFLIA